jgi:dCTP deaminase
MIYNGISLLSAAPIKDMLETKERAHGVSHGLSEAGYDIRIKQEITFKPATPSLPASIWVDGIYKLGKFALASTIEEFQMPPYLVGVVHDKSTWARRGLSVRNTVIEPGWNGFLTLELVYDGRDIMTIPAGAGIAQVLFHEVASPAQYEGKYQNQADKPVEAIYD